MSNLKIFYSLVVKEAEKQKNILKMIIYGLRKEKEMVQENGYLRIKYFTPKITWLSRLIVSVTRTTS